MDIESLSAKELAELISKANKRKRVLAKRKPIMQVRAAVNRVIRTSGYTFEELFGTAAPKAPARGRSKPAAEKVRATRKLPKVEPKYRNPANAAETWSGRGKQPRWLASYTSQGRSLEEFLIKQDA